MEFTTRFSGILACISKQADSLEHTYHAQPTKSKTEPNNDKLFHNQVAGRATSAWPEYYGAGIRNFYDKCARLLHIKQLVQLAPRCHWRWEALTELESIDARACCNISTLHCQFEILTQFKLQNPLARFAKICSVSGPNSEQSAMSPMCDQGISNGWLWL